MDSIAQIENFNQKAWALRLMDVEESLSCCYDALALSEDLCYEKGIAEALRTTGFCHIRLAKPKEAIPFLDRALQLFQKIGHSRGQGQVQEFLGLVYRSLGDYKSSLNALFTALQIQRDDADFEGESLTMYHIGISYKYLGNIEQALEYLLESLQLAKAVNYSITESYALNYLGVIYADMGDFVNALDYYEQSLKIRCKLGDKWGEAGCLDNIGLIHYNLKQFEKGLQYCSESLLITQKIGDKRGVGNSLYHLGMLYNKLDNRERAIYCTKESLQTRTEIGDKRGKIESLLLLDDLYVVENGKESEDLLKEADKIAQEIQAKDLFLQIHQKLYKYYKNNAFFEKALSHLEAQLQLEKELYTQSIKQKLSNQKINHQIEQAKKEAENIAIRAELDLLRDRQRIARDLHDEVGSTLSSISILSEAFLRNVQSDIDKARFGDLGNKARNALENISDIVWSVNPENDTLDKLLTRMVNYAAEVLENIGIELFLETEEFEGEMNLPMEMRKDLYMIFKEAINNIVKYAQAKKVWVSMKKQDSSLVMTIIDDGVGFEPKAINRGLGGNGLKNMQHRAAAMGANFLINSIQGQGSTLHLTIPLVP